MPPNTDIKFTSVEFRNYKAFRHFSIQIQNMNILVGPNNCGKSTVIRAFRIAETALRQARAKNADRVHGPNNKITWGHRVPDKNLPVSLENVHTEYEEIESSIRFRCSNGNELLLFFPEDGGCVLIPRDRNGTVRTAGRVRKEFPRIQTVPELGPLENEEEVVSEETVRRGLSTHRASRHFRNYWRVYPDGFKDFAALVARTWPGMEIEPPELTDALSRRLTMFCREDRLSREIYWAGFGFQVWCQLLTHISRASIVDVLVVDEPEIYLHPDVQRQLVGILRSLGTDVIAASHSTEIIGEADPSEIAVIDKRKRSAKRLRDAESVQLALTSIGSLHNITLTQLARYGRLLFLENKEDFRIIRRFASALGYQKVATGSGITVAESEGFAGWQRVLSAAWAFEKTLEGQFRIGIILDRDYHSDEEIDEVVHELQGHFQPVHVHERKEIENYFLNPTVLERAAKRAITERNSRTGENGALRHSITSMLEEISSSMKQDVQAQFIAKRINWFRRKGVDDSTASSEALRIIEDSWSELEQRMKIVPGKEVLQALRRELQDTYSVTLTNVRIVDAFRIDDIPDDLSDLIQEIEAFGSEAT